MSGRSRTAAALDDFGGAVAESRFISVAQGLEGRVVASWFEARERSNAVPEGATARWRFDREDESLAAKETDPSSGEE
jgi:hypothetical protein